MIHGEVSAGFTTFPSQPKHNSHQQPFLIIKRSFQRGELSKLELMKCKAQKEKAEGKRKASSSTTLIMIQNEELTHTMSQGS